MELINYTPLMIIPSGISIREPYPPDAHPDTYIRNRGAYLDAVNFWYSEGWKFRFRLGLKRGSFESKITAFFIIGNERIRMNRGGKAPNHDIYYYYYDSPTINKIMNFRFEVEYTYFWWWKRKRSTRTFFVVADHLNELVYFSYHDSSKSYTHPVSAKATEVSAGLGSQTCFQNLTEYTLDVVVEYNETPQKFTFLLNSQTPEAPSSATRIEQTVAPFGYFFISYARIDFYIFQSTIQVTATSNGELIEQYTIPVYGPTTEG